MFKGSQDSYRVLEQMMMMTMMMMMTDDDDLPNDIWGQVKIMKLLIVQLPALSVWTINCRSSSKQYLRIQPVPQREHHTSPL
jgi:hypothetical protein